MFVFCCFFFLFCLFFFFFFFILFFVFQAEDGIRDVAVTGVQTCALPIFISIDVNEETSAFAKSFIQQTEYASQIELVLADAKDYIPTISSAIDLVFIDADKKNYLNYFHLVIDKQIGRASCRERV